MRDERATSKKKFAKPLDKTTAPWYNRGVREGRKTQTNQKGRTQMKKSTMISLLAYLNGETVTNIDEIRDELAAELAKGEAKAEANREMYELAHDVAINALASCEEGMTISELWKATEEDMPEGFSKGKLQYAVTRMWMDELVKIEGKVNKYAVRV